MPVASPRFGGMPTLLLGWNRCGRFGAQWRGGVQSSGTAQPRCSASGSDAGSTHHRLSGTNGAAINRLAGNGRGASSGHARPRRGRLGLTRRGTRLLQPSHHVGARRNYRTRDRLARQGRPGLRPQWHCGSWSAGRSRRGGRCSERRRRCWRSRGQWLARSGKNLAGARSGPGRRGRPGWNGSGPQRRMYRRSSAHRQRRPQRRRFCARRFFGCCLTGSIGVLGRGYFRNRSRYIFGRRFGHGYC